MNNRSFIHLAAVLQALLVTFLWSTSWVLIKFGLDDLPALTFAGLRYTFAFLCLLPFLLQPTCRADIRHLSRADWCRLLVLGLLFYAITQGAQFVGLAYLPAITVNLLLNFTTVLVAFLGLVLLAERLRTLSAVESSIINSTMIVQIPLLAFMFLGESLTVRQALGMLLAGMGALVVQLRLRTKSNVTAPDLATADKLRPEQAIDRS